MKLGRRAIRRDARTLHLSKYFTPILPPPPVRRGYAHGIRQWGMLANDTLGDCTCAAVGHAIQVLTANASTEAVITDAETITAYEKWCNYDPNDPNSDQGGVCLDVLNSWRQGGFSGHPLLAYATAMPANSQHIMQAINLFGGVYIGFNVPQFALPGDGTIPPLWDVQPRGDNTIIGGHCVFVLAYSPAGLTCVTWGQIQPMTWAFWNQFVDEAYALVSPEWISATGKAPNGFDLAALESDLVQVTN